MTPETQLTLAALAFILLMLSLFILSRFGGKSGQAVEIDVTEDGHGTSHDAYTNRGK